jgi:hypothetical protein
LTRWLEREATANTSDLRSPIFGKLSRDEVLKRFDPQFREAMESIDPYLQEILMDAEMGQRENISVQSAYEAWEQDGPEKVANVYSDKDFSPDMQESAFEEAFREVSSMIPQGSIRVTSPKQAVRGAEHARYNPHAIDQEGMDITTNSGPITYNSHWWYTEGMPADKGEQAEISMQVILDRANEAVADYKAGRDHVWGAIAAKRLAQKKDPKKRKRLVIALEKAEPVVVKTFSPEVQEKLRSYRARGGVHVYGAWIDLPRIDQDMQLMLHTAEDGGRSVISGDISGYDASIPPKLIAKMGYMIGRWLFNAEYLGVGLCNSLAYGVDLITPNRIWDHCPSSMKSGSGLTNLVDSLILHTILVYGEKIGLYEIVNVAVQGDDFVLDAKGADPEKVQTVFSHFGMDAHPDKQMYKRKALNYLQRTHYLGWTGGISSAYRTLGSLLSYERLRYRSKDWTGYTDVVRAISQLDNLVFSPVFEASVEFVREGDKFNLGADISPSQVLQKSGDAGEDVIYRDSNASWKSGGDIDGFARNAVNGVLRGEQLPPLGSNERFVRAYSEERIERAQRFE